MTLPRAARPAAPPEGQLAGTVEALAADLGHARTHDPLTGLANRAAFGTFVEAALSTPRRADRSPVIAVIDLGSVRAVNHTYGPATGDELLQLTAERLAALVDDADLVARLGSDEFGVVKLDADSPGAAQLAEQIERVMAEPVVIGGVAIPLRLSAGLHRPAPGQAAWDAIQAAGDAMSAAKAAGGGVDWFDRGRHLPVAERHQLEVELWGASTRGELEVYYQPLLDLRTRTVVGAEALVRWEHPTRGLLQPAEFIDLAEESGLIVELGRWVLDRATSDAVAWPDLAGRGALGVAVNVSRRQLRSPTVVGDIGTALRHSGLAPELLTVEVTETALMTEPARLVATLQGIKALGVELAMDDFGTGYSSLSQLRDLPIDILKIDKAFVAGIASDEQEWALAAAITRLAGSLGKTTLAEGIERAAQLAHLRSLGCELGQGWLFAPALRREAFVDFLTSGPRSR